MNVASLKDDMQDVLFAIYGSVSGDVTTESDVIVYDPVIDNASISDARTTRPWMQGVNNRDWEIKATVKAYIDWTTGVPEREYFEFKCTQKADVDYSAEVADPYDPGGVPTVTLKDNTFEWDERDPITHKMILTAGRLGYARA